MSKQFFGICSIFNQRSDFLHHARAVVGIGIAFLKVPALYNAAGFRLEKMIDYVVNNDVSADRSLALRKGFGEISPEKFSLVFSLLSSLSEP